jgi:putative SOS response-associated peptidase YedK
MNFERAFGVGNGLASAVMCGRFTLKTSPVELQDELELVLSDAVELLPRYNIAPSQPVAVVTNGRRREVELFRWGLIPGWAKDPRIGNRMINARAETLTEKPAFRVPLLERRCIVLADGFFEWRPDGRSRTPTYIQLESRRPFALAGLWDAWVKPDGEMLRTCTIVTTAPNEFMARYHNRMPAILPRDQIAGWLCREEKDVDALMSMLRPWSGEPLEAHAVSSLVNDPATDSPECIERVPEPLRLFG